MFEVNRQENRDIHKGRKMVIQESPNWINYILPRSNYSREKSRNVRKYHTEHAGKEFQQVLH